jgi:undecaprenyl-diphosphatase
MLQIFIAIILGIVEGLTEFLPISSTGHLIIVNHFLGFSGEFANAFDIIIQLGAILAVVVYFRKKILSFGNAKERAKTFDIYKKVIVAVIPAIIIGALLGGKIQDALFNPLTVAVMLIIGGILILLIERKQIKSKIDSISSLTYKTAFFIGLIQCLALIPGTSRSAATIIGAILLGASRLVATEFSFYLAIPTIVAASAYSMLKLGVTLTKSDMIFLAVGLIVSFLVAFAVIAWLMNYIKKHDFKGFGYYRIVLGVIILAYLYFILA